MTKLSCVAAGPVLVSSGASFSQCLTVSEWNMTSVPLFIENLGVGRALFLCRSDCVRYLYTVAIGMLVLKEWTLIQCLCQYEEHTQEILP